MIVNLLKGVLLEPPPTYWGCPNCPATDMTKHTEPHTRFHTCAGLKGLTAPMIPVGTKARVVAVERGDYVGKEMVQKDGEGRPVMAVRTDYADGRNDIAVLAPTATTTAVAREFR